MTGDGGFQKPMGLGIPGQRTSNCAEKGLPEVMASAQRVAEIVSRQLDSLVRDEYARAGRLQRAAGL